MLLALPGCDTDKAAAAEAPKAAEAEAGDKNAKDAAQPAAKVAPAADGLDPSLDNSGFDDTGKAIAKLFDASKTCAFDRNSQIGGCKPYDEFRAMQRKISPMTKEFSEQRDLVALTRLQSKEATVRAWAYNHGRNAHRSRAETEADSRTAIEKALLVETDAIALLVGLRAVRDHIKAHPSLVPVFEKHAANADADVAKTAREALDKAAK